MTSKTTSPGILVTGATGRHGGTGAHVVRALRAAGRPVRILARRKSPRTEALEALGAEIALGDLHDRASLVRALEGIGTATFTYPIGAGVVEAAATFAAAAHTHEAPLRVVVNSMGPAHPESPSHLGRAQWLAEEVLGWAGLDLCVLRITALFFENIPTLHGSTIRREGVIRNCFGSVDAPWISGLDAAHLVVAAVLHPDRFAGSKVHHPPGAEHLSHAAIAEILTRELSRPVRFEPISQDAWIRELSDLAARDPDGPVNPDMARHIAAVGAAIATRGPTRRPDAAALRGLTGSEPLSFEAFVRQGRDLFA
ncbi:NmrA family NAD(P)-binding protein [Polyangium sp. y55x31]|uniref:NmrA family NAD(P)-binding protein n=1 Tax=Polyangium sp. y55x31 TaxID=3042688 RepID=UPI002482B52F|nr:NmrA family NAD(P)-binding protein [Polyangium sp. y55x31]MDI1475181.1 NmrA family NAD(P)-binding protein [Polyangium sp. y55x31]